MKPSPSRADAPPTTMRALAESMKSGPAPTPAPSASHAAPGFDRRLRAGDWIAATRPRTLVATLVPVLVGLALAWRDGGIAPGVAALTLALGLSIQIATNLANDYFDGRRGADGPDRLGPERLSGQDPSVGAAVWRATVLVLVLAALAGGLLAWIGGWPILLVGIVSLACALGYTAGPFPIAYHGLGELFVFVFFGPVAVAGTYWLQRGAIAADIAMASVPVGCVATAILVVNNLRDIPGDARVGKRTLAVRIGARATRVTWVVLVAVALVTALVVAGPVVLLALPLALYEARSLFRRDGRALNASLAGSARLHLVLGALIAIGVAIA
jgi:1,4-dihydroxy-2-naphthoate octaprenyltransferase